MRVWIRGLSVWKSSCKERTHCIQHHMLSEVGGVTESAMAISSAEAVSFCPTASTSMMWHSTSLQVCKFEYNAYFPTSFTPHSLQVCAYLSQTDLCSWRMTLIPFGFPLSSGSGWSSGKHIFCTQLCVSSLPCVACAGGGLLSGITVSHSFLCLPLWCIFILLTLRASSAKPLYAEDWSKTKIATQSRWVCLKILSVSLTCSIN